MTEAEIQALRDQNAAGTVAYNFYQQVLNQGQSQTPTDIAQHSRYWKYISPVIQLTNYIKDNSWDPTFDIRKYRDQLNAATKLLNQIPQAADLYQQIQDPWGDARGYLVQNGIDPDSITPTLANIQEARRLAYGAQAAQNATNQKLNFFVQQHPELRDNGGNAYNASSITGFLNLVAGRDVGYGVKGNPLTQDQIDKANAAFKEWQTLNGITPTTPASTPSSDTQGSSASTSAANPFSGRNIYQPSPTTTKAATTQPSSTKYNGGTTTPPVNPMSGKDIYAPTLTSTPPSQSASPASSSSGQNTFPTTSAPAPIVDTATTPYTQAVTQAMAGSIPSATSGIYAALSATPTLSSNPAFGASFTFPTNTNTFTQALIDKLKKQGIPSI